MRRGKRQVATAAPVLAPAVPGCPIRRRGEALEQAILEATLNQLNAVGFANLTMEGVAACARTGKASLYRRWGCKEDLVLDAFQQVMPGAHDDPATGSLRTDLLAVLNRTVAVLGSPVGRVVRTLLAEVDADSELARSLRNDLLEPRRASLLRLFERAAAHGELRAGTVTPTIAEVGPAMLLYRFLMSGQLSEQDVTAVVDEVILPLVRP